VILLPLPLASQEDPESRELLSYYFSTQRERASQAHETNNYHRKLHGLLGSAGRFTTFRTQGFGRQRPS